MYNIYAHMSEDIATSVEKIVKYWNKVKSQLALSPIA
jgi:hypothetical protein